MTRPRGWTEHLKVHDPVWIHVMWKPYDPDSYQRGTVCQITRTMVVVRAINGGATYRFYNHRPVNGDREGRCYGDDGLDSEMFPATDENDLFAARFPDTCVAEELVDLRRSVIAAVSKSTDSARLRRALDILTERPPHGRRRR